MIICIETATTICSVALCNSDGVVSLIESDDFKSHASQLTLFINDVLSKNGIRATDLDAVAVSKGPGSYTGLRIGVSVAKGITFGASVPLIGIDTTLSMLYGLSQMTDSNITFDENTIFCPMLDARRMEVYNAIYDFRGILIKNIAAEIIDEESFASIPESKKIIFFGDGAAKCKTIINRNNIYFADQYKISASHMRIPAFQSFEKNIFEDIAYFEPFYLKDFITTKPRKNILGL